MQQLRQLPSNPPHYFVQVVEMLSLWQQISNNNGKSPCFVFGFHFIVVYCSIRLNFNRKSNLIDNNKFFYLRFDLVLGTGLHRTNIQLRIVIKKRTCSELLKLPRTSNRRRPPLQAWNHCIRCHHRICHCCRALTTIQMVEASDQKHRSVRRIGQWFARIVPDSG